MFCLKCRGVLFYAQSDVIFWLALFAIIQGSTFELGYVCVFVCVCVIFLYPFVTKLGEGMFEIIWLKVGPKTTSLAVLTRMC